MGPHVLSHTTVMSTVGNILSRLLFLAVPFLAACSRTTADTVAPPVIHVGIVQHADSLIISDKSPDGTTVATYRIGAADVADSLLLRPALPGGALEVSGVTIGIGFHWQQRENQLFGGTLRVVHDSDSTLTLINDIDIESYLESVISSEMSADAPRELLFAHAIASRSWLLKQLGKRHARETRSGDSTEITVWYDRDDHTLFDVCADDHCQRYQGVERLSGNNVVEAVRETCGVVLADSAGDVCDARFSKCCGGVTEEFESCWEPEHHDYLVAVCDAPAGTTMPDLRDNAEAQRWILSNPDAFCSSPDTALLALLLNSYDRATADYYRWQVTYTAGELGQLVARKLGRDPGCITRLQPLQRGPSGRIIRLKIVGSRDSLIVGKELEIRRALSPSHLYSSAFVATIDGDGPDATVTLNGAGWGHGVGMCQIGAAMMAAGGYDHRDILAHYFPNTTLRKLWTSK